MGTFNSHIGLLILRLFSGGLMLVHGVPKLMNLFTQSPIQFPDPIGVGATVSLALAVFSEFICAVLIILGFKTRWATIPLIITMAVAGFVVHFSDPFGRKEKAILYLVMYVTLFFTGAGKYSVDKQ